MQHMLNEIMTAEILLVILLLTGIIARSSLIATASCLLLLLHFAHADRLLQMLQRYGIELGLLFLLLSLLIPLTSGQMTLRDTGQTCASVSGMAAIIGGALAACLNAAGLDLLQLHPGLIIGLLLGQIIGIVFFKGMPTGPVMSAGITVILLWLLELLT